LAVVDYTPHAGDDGSSEVVTAKPNFFLISKIQVDYFAQEYKPNFFLFSKIVIYYFSQTLILICATL
jgi:hypothetical protein